MELSELQSLCQFTLQDFNLCMFYEPPHQLTGNPHIDDLDSGDDCSADPGDPLSFLYLDNDIVFKIVCCLICTIHLLEKNGNLKQQSLGTKKFSRCSVYNLVEWKMNRLETRLSGL